MRYSEIDYSKHPAYGLYQSEFYGDDSSIVPLIASIDDIHGKFTTLSCPTNADAVNALSEIQVHMDKILRDPKGESKSVIVKEWLDSSLRWTLSDLSYEYARKVFSGRDYKSKILSDNEKAQLALMQNQGMYIADLPTKTYGMIRELTLKHMAELRQRALLDPLNRSVISVPFNSDLWNAIKLASRESGILDVLSEFKKNQMTLLGAGLEYSCSEQNWYQSLYSDVGLTDSSLRYLHIDEGECLPKSMIYITPVSEESGPTKVIPQSNHWEKSEFLIHMHKALDNVVGYRYANYVRKSHYRPIARHAELRRIFMGLPKPFQGSSHFGDDLLNGSEVTNTLEKLEISYCSQGGDALVFDGPHLFHRGSLVKTGERLALQVVYRNQNAEDIKFHISGETIFGEQAALAKKYARKFLKKFV